jgi:hypothetical protein
VRQEFSLGDNRSGAAGQILQHAVFHGHKIHGFSGSLDAAVSPVDFKIADSEHWLWLTLPAPDQSFGSRQKFSQIERFRKIVVGFAIEQLDD